MAMVEEGVDIFDFNSDFLELRLLSVHPFHSLVKMKPDEAGQFFCFDIIGSGAGSTVMEIQFSKKSPTRNSRNETQGSMLIMCLPGLCAYEAKVRVRQMCAYHHPDVVVIVESSTSVNRNLRDWSFERYEAFQDLGMSEGVGKIYWSCVTGARSHHYQTYRYPTLNSCRIEMTFRVSPY